MSVRFLFCSMNIRVCAMRVNESKCPFESLKPEALRGGSKSLIMPKWCQCAPGALSMLRNLRPAARSLSSGSLLEFVRV